MSAFYFSLECVLLIVEGVIFITGRLFCTVGVHPTRCKVSLISRNVVFGPSVFGVHV